MGKNILLVDNDKEFTDINKKALEAEGFTVSLAATSKEALEKLKENKPDLILTEIMLENSDSGFSLCHSARKKHPEIPILILSDVVRNTGITFNLSTKDEKDWIKANELLHKPINPSLLVNKIKNYLK